MTFRTEVCSHRRMAGMTGTIDFLATFVYNRKVIKRKGNAHILDCRNKLCELDTMDLSYHVNLSSIEDIGNICLSNGYIANKDSVQQFVSDARIIELVVAWMGDYSHE